MGSLDIAITRQHAFEAGAEGGFDLGSLFQSRQQHRGRLDGRQRVATWLTAHLSVARRLPRPEDDAPES